MGRAAERIQQEDRSARNVRDGSELPAKDDRSARVSDADQPKSAYHAHQKRADGAQTEDVAATDEAGADTALQDATQEGVQALPGQAAIAAASAEGDLVRGKGDASMQALLGKAAATLTDEANAQLQPGGAVKDPSAALQASALQNGQGDQVLQPAKEGLVDAKAEGEVDLNDLLRYSQAARRHGPGDAAAAVTTLDEAANASQRNQLLSQMGLTQASGTDGTASTATQTSAAAVQTDQTAFWKDRMQSEANLLREIRQSTLDQSSASAAAVGTAQASSLATARPALFSAGDGRGVEAEVLNKVVQEAKWLIRNNQKEVQLKLNPEHLGNLNMRVTQKDGHVKVDMMVDNHMVKHLIESNLNDLRARLDTQNLGADAFQFNVDIRQGTDSNGSEFFEQSASSAQYGVTAESKEAEALKQAATRPVWSANGLSLYA